MPEKYYAMHDFHEYYSGSRTAPYLTIFIGGNHEASSYMWELYYGGWAAPNIYYMGAANVVRLGPLRIAGLSGIWKGYDYRKPHYERLPYNADDVKSIYHVRELDVRKLLQLRSQVDIGLSHDWPKGMEWKGDHAQLFRFKPYFKTDAVNGQLGSVAATYVLERLRPPYWFSAHMHAKYTAVWKHAEGKKPPPPEPEEVDIPAVKNEDEIMLEIDDSPVIPAVKNDDEISLDLGDETEPTTAVQKVNGTDNDPPLSGDDDVFSLLPESFKRPSASSTPPTLPFPKEISNETTKFLALDKCLANRNFLQLLEIAPHSPAEFQRPVKLEYDQEWLAITRVFAADLQLGDPGALVVQDKGDVHYRPLIEKEMAWVEEHIVQAGKMAIPTDFAQTAPVYEPGMGIKVAGGPEEYSNPHTQGFCDLVQIPNALAATDEERAQMMQRGPRPGSARSDRRGGGHSGGNRGRGQGRGRGGANNRGRGYRGRGRGGNWG